MGLKLVNARVTSRDGMSFARCVLFNDDDSHNGSERCQLLTCYHVVGDEVRRQNREGTRCKRESKSRP